MARLVGRTRTEGLRTQLPILLSIVAVLAFTPIPMAQSQTTVESPTATPSCAKTDFQCQDGSCIPRESLCNNVTDCANGEDEGVHLCGCPKTEFRCADGTCLPDAMHCDGKLDCAGGEDEAVCTTQSTTCSASMFFCGPLDGDCIELFKVCDGFVDCFVSRSDEENCPSVPGSPCSGGQFECSGEDDVASHVQGSDCIPLRQQCDTVFQCANGADESGCTFPKLIQPPQSQAVMSGDVVNLTCIAEGTPTPTITWLRNLMPLPGDTRYQVTSVGGVGTLTISQATVLDIGEYSCQVSTPRYSFVSEDKAAVNVTNDNPESCLSSDGSTYLEGDRFFTVVDNVSGSALSTAADIVFVVDQSGSMLEAQQWIGDVAPLLDETLQSNGVGVGNLPNQFALVGFGAMETFGGTVLTQLTSVDNFVAVTPGLTIDGTIEDGYSGIQVALDQVELRNGSGIVHVMVLVTNGERDTIPGNEDLTRDVIEEKLRESGFVLNVVVGQGFPTDMEFPAFGMDFNGTCYSYDFANEIVIHPSCERNDGIGSTYEDYVQLAYNLQGSAWDIQAIEGLDDVGLNGFSRSFVAAKVDEVMGLLRHCSVCTCKQDPLDCELVPDVALEDCKGRAPPKDELIVTVSPKPASNIPIGSDVVLTCDIFISPQASEDEITIQWEKVGEGPLCSPPDCMRSITLTNIEVGDEGLYVCRVTAGDQEEQGDTFLTTVVPPVIVTPPTDTTSREGKPVQVTCVAEGKPEPLVYWVRSDGGSLSDSALVEATTESSSKLVIDPAKLEDSGQYECVAINTAGTAKASFTIEVNSANCVVSDKVTLLPGQSQIVLVYELAVDLVLLVDESGSMLTEHKWLVQMVTKLDESLRKVGVGVDEPNLIAVVGFGSQYQDYESGRVVSQFVSSDQIGAVIDDLWVDGKREDGYVAIQFALDNLQFRQGTARQFILVTDEDRYPVDPSHTYDSIKKVLEDAQTRLNVIVSEKFAGNRSVPAMGVDDSLNAYVYYPLASHYSEMPANLSVRVVDGGHAVPNSGHGDTHDDYTSLVLELGGAAWDLGLLSMGPPVVDAFTSAFIAVEAQEILDQVSKCQNCSCGDAGLQCTSLYPFVNIYPECSIPDFPEDELLPLDQTLDVTIDPRFHRFPNNGNQNTALVCSVVGDDDATYQWTFNSHQLQSNTDVSSIDGDSMLTLQNPNDTATGWYTCFADKLDSTTGFETAYVEVYEPVVMLEPLRSEAVVGDNVSITARLKEAGTFTWSFWNGSDPYTESNALPDNAVANDLSSTESVLTITDVDKSNTGLYICRGGAPNRQGTSRAEVLVSEPELKISVHPEVARVCEGAKAVLTCQVDCPCQGITLRWTLAQGIALPSGLEIYEGDDGRSLLLVMEEATPELARQYQCSATFGTQRRSQFGYVEVIDSPTSGSQDPLPKPVLSLGGGKVVAPINSSVKVDCSSEVPNPVITWGLADGSDDLPEGVVVNMTSSDTSVFSISSVQEGHYMKYYCSVGTVYEECGPDPVTSAFQIFEPAESPLRAPTVDPHPASGPIEVDLGASVTVRCTSNVPYAIFTWQRLHAPYELPEGIVTYEEGLQTSILSIDVMNESMYAQYLCKVRTPPSLNEGPLSTVFTIAEPDIIGVAVDIPEFTRPENLITEENPMVIVCSFTCIVCSGASLQWTYVGGPLPSGVTTRTSPVGRTIGLEISDGSADQSGTYVCSAVMNDGTVAHSVEVNVTILVTASVWIPNRSKKVPPGESAIFRCQTSRAAVFGWNFKTVDGSLPATAAFKTISETESQLNVSNVMHNVNTGKYFCAAEFPTGESLKADADLSEQAPLSVAFKVPPDNEPLEELSLTVSAGAEAAVECSLTCGSRCPSARVKWLDSDRNAISTSSMDDVWQQSPVTERLSTLRIKSPSETNVGEYICRASSTGEESTFTSLTIILEG